MQFNLNMIKLRTGGGVGFSVIDRDSLSVSVNMGENTLLNHVFERGSYRITVEVEMGSRTPLTWSRPLK